MRNPEGGGFLFCLLGGNIGQAFIVSKILETQPHPTHSIPHFLPSGEKKQKTRAAVLGHGPHRAERGGEARSALGSPGGAERVEREVHPTGAACEEKLW